MGVEEEADLAISPVDAHILVEEKGSTQTPLPFQPLLAVIPSPSTLPGERFQDGNRHG